MQCEVLGGMLEQEKALEGQIIIGYMNITTSSSPWRERILKSVFEGSPKDSLQE